MYKNNWRQAVTWTLSIMLVGCTPINSPTPTVVSTKTQMLTTATPRAINTPTPTPEKVTKNDVLALFKNNGGCELPCIWGITPGKTLNSAVEGLAAPFGDFAIYVLWETMGIFAIKTEDEEKRPDITISFGPLTSEEIEWLNFNPTLSYKNSSGEYEISSGRGDPKLLEYFSYYSIANIFSLYGEPDLIFISQGNFEEPGARSVFALTLVYPLQGIWVEYFGAVRKSEGENLEICPLQTSLIMWLWEAGRYSSIDELQATEIPIRGWGPAFGDVKSLKELINLTPTEFYSTFKGASYETCLQVPREKWMP